MDINKPKNIAILILIGQLPILLLSFIHTGKALGIPELGFFIATLILTLGFLLTVSFFACCLVSKTLNNSSLVFTITGMLSCPIAYLLLSPANDFSFQHLAITSFIYAFFGACAGYVYFPVIKLLKSAGVQK